MPAGLPYFVPAKTAEGLDGSRTASMYATPAIAALADACSIVLHLQALAVKLGSTSGIRNGTYSMPATVFLPEHPAAMGSACLMRTAQS